jgi:Flp pilus assembly protein TadB
MQKANVFVYLVNALTFHMQCNTKCNQMHQELQNIIIIFGFLFRLMMIVDIIGRPVIKVVLNTKLGWWWWWRRRRRRRRRATI